MAERVRVREITNEEGNRLLRIVRRSSGSVVTWRRAQMVLLQRPGHGRRDDRPGDLHQPRPGPRRAAQLQPRWVRLAVSALCRRPAAHLHPGPAAPDQAGRAVPPDDHDLPFSTWSLAKLADFLVAEGVVDDISHEGLRVLLREEGVSFQVIKTWKQSRDPDFEAKKNRILHLYGLMDGTDDVQDGDPEVVICVDEFGPLNLQPHPGRQWASRGGGGASLAAGGGRPTPARTGCGTCWPPTTCPATSCTATSSPASAAGSSWCSCAICARLYPPGVRTCDRAGQLHPAPVDPR